jgi:L-alanine-DL-glutamate epimerase-like enolase superfamily enzyme
LILHNNAGPLGAAASLHAALATPNVTLLEAPWVNGSGETDVAGGAPVWPYPEIVDGYALPLEGTGLGIEANVRLDDEALAASKPFVSSLQVPRLRGPAEWAGRVGAGFLNTLRSVV